MDKYIDRELSWLAFNERVLEEARRDDTPTLEKVKFLSIFSSNLDEFFMVRVAGLQHMIAEELTSVEYPDIEAARKSYEQIAKTVKRLTPKQYEFYHDIILPAMKAKNIEIVEFGSLEDKYKSEIEKHFHENIKPVLTPMAIDPGHPAPFLSNLEIYLVSKFKTQTARKDLLPLLGIVQIPKILPRFYQIKTGSKADLKFISIENIIANHIESLFLGFKCESTAVMRVIRNLDYELLENEVVDLLAAVKKEMTESRQKEIVRLEITQQVEPDVLAKVCSTWKVDLETVFKMPGMIGLSSLSFFHNLPLPDKFKPFNPRLPAAFSSSESIFSLIRKQDILLHHPYDSFYPIVEFLNAAADDPEVIAIKQTLYRTSGDSPIMNSLINAAEKGKQVTAVVELKARFDESNNIEWAQQLERAGVHVVFGFVGLKTHVKSTLIIKRERKQLKMYAHLSTGNYNTSTARLYTDIGILTSDQQICEDVANLFNFLTGFNILGGEIAKLKESMVPTFKKLIISPLGMRKGILDLIHQEIDFHKKSGDGLIMAKMNSLVDEEVIDALYAASSAGVTIKLIIRGICRLRPGVKDLSENISVVSIIDRFLEHSRVFYFHSGGSKRVYLSSADWMPRNFDRRVEAMTPIQSEALKSGLVDEVLGSGLKDNVRAWVMEPNGEYRQKEREGEAFRSQEYLIQVARTRGVKSLPYDEALKITKHQGRTSKRPVAAKKT